MALLLMNFKATSVEFLANGLRIRTMLGTKELDWKDVLLLQGKDAYLILRTNKGRFDLSSIEGSNVVVKKMAQALPPEKLIQTKFKK
jgi:hypothetical protein